MPKHLIWIALLGGGVFAACRPSASNDADGPNAGNRPDPEQRRNTNLTRLYEDTCGKCHGMRGEGGGGGTKTLLTRDKFDQKNDRPFFDAIKKGVADMGMEGYGASLSDEEIWGLVVHIRELQAQGLRREFGSPKATDGVYASQHHKFRLETVLENAGLSTPWSMDWLPDGRFLLTNRPGRMVIVKDGKVEADVSGLPKSVEIGQGGLMEVAVHPDFAQNGWIYLTLCEPGQNGGGMTKVVRGKLSRNQWTGQQTIYEAAQEFYSGAGIHFGSKIAFDGKGHLFFSVGERGTNMRAQDPKTPYGKVMRVNEDGSIPADNPWPGSPVWSYGHRNPQGLAFDAKGGLWDTEHGPRGGDEVNRIEKGANYGWPVVAWSINYNDTPYQTPWPKDNLKVNQPIFRWLPSIGASGLDLVEGAAFPKWSGDLLAGGLSGNNVDRFRIVDGKLVEREELLQGMGRVRDIKVAKDGSVYIVLNGPDKVFRLVPAG